MSTTKSKKKADSPAKSEEEIPAQDPRQMHDARKALYASARRARKDGIKRNAEEIGVDPSSEEALRGANEDEAQAAAKAIKAQQEEESGHSEEKATKKPQKDVDRSMVDVVLFGRSYKVPQADIDRAGGLEAYQKTRAADIRLQEAAALEQRMRLRQREMDQQRASERDQEKEAGNRQTSTQPASDGKELPGQDAQNAPDRKEKVQKIVKRMFSGREDQVSEAVEEILDSSAARPEISAEAVAQQVLAKLKEDQAKADQQSAEATWKAQFEEQRREVNELMSGEFNDVNSHPILRNVAQAAFKEARERPENQGRRLVDMAREAGELARKVIIQEDSPERRRKEKEGSPPPTRAAGRATPADAKKPMTRSEYVAEMRKRRGLG